MKLNVIRSINKIICFFLLLTGFTGCVVEDSRPGSGTQTDQFIVEMTLPAFETPKFTSIDVSENEAVVKTLDLLVFDKSTPAQFIERIKATEFTQESSDSEYKVLYNLELPEDTNAGLIVTIANASAEVDAALVLNPPGTEKQDILNLLRFATGPDEEGTYKWKMDEDAYTPIPMYGESAVNDIVPGSKINISLKRMLARIDVQNEVNGSVFQLKQIYVVNYRTQGYIAPAWNTSNGVLLTEENEDYPYTNNLNPLIPSTAGKPSEEMVYKYTQNDTETGPLMAGQIYTYEALKAEDDADKTAVCLILLGNYKGQDYYYRVDFTTNKNNSLQGDKIQYMPLYRNHKYIVNIEAVEGIGYTSFDAALESTSVLSNLKTSLMVIDMIGINDIVYDGQYFMGVESRTLNIPWSFSGEINHRVSSNYTGNWEAVVMNGFTWLWFPGNKLNTSGTNINNTGIDLQLSLLPFVEDDAISQVQFTAGRLRDTLTVNRVPLAGMFARSNIIVSGNTLTFAVTPEDNQTIPAYSQGVLFKWGSLIALSPAGNPYQPENHVIYNPTGQDPAGWGSGLEGWDNIPYAHSSFGFNVPVSTEDDKDMFKEYNDYTGYDEYLGVGDICRYISSKGWVEGDWRMPTYLELDKLGVETSSTSKIGSFSDNTSSVTDSYRTGTFNPQSGYFLGHGVNSSTATTSNMKVPPKQTVFLPTSGERYPNGDGIIVDVGAYGYYWSATPYTQYSINYLFLSSWGIEPYEADRSYAFPVRCIRDY